MQRNKKNIILKLKNLLLCKGENRLKILYVTSLGFKEASSASIRNISLINGLIENGCQVDLLTLSYPEAVEDQYLTTILSKKVRVFKSEISLLNNYLDKKPKSFTFKKTTLLSAAKDIIKSFYFFPDVDKEWISNYNKEVLEGTYDFVISSSDTKTSHYVAQKIIEQKKEAKWIQIWGDPWENDIHTKKYMRQKIQRHEKQLLALADFVFYVSEPTMKDMKTKYLQLAHKIHYLGRSFIEVNKGRALGTEENWIFTYTGALNKNRDISALVKAINQYNERHTKKIELNIYGLIDTETSKIIQNNSKINYHGSVDLTTINAVYKDTDVLIYIDNGGETSQIPGKIYDYFGTDRPILALVENKNAATTKFLKEADRCEVQLNNQASINFEFLDNIVKEKVLKEYTGYVMAKKMLDHLS